MMSNSYKSIDVNIHHCHFYWDTEQGTYVPTQFKSIVEEKDGSSASPKAELAINQLQTIVDPKEVAKNIGF